MAPRGRHDNPDRNTSCSTFELQSRGAGPFLGFTVSGEALWERNFRDLNGAVTRMCTVTAGGRITVAIVDEEIERLRRAWARRSNSPSDDQLLFQVLGSQAAVEALDLFDRMQLAGVLKIVGASRSLSEAGRALFANSRERKQSSNDADRLRKYLARFGITWDIVRDRVGHANGD
jgi:transcriptional regulatory protein RtcR